MLSFFLSWYTCFSPPAYLCCLASLARPFGLSFAWMSRWHFAKRVANNYYYYYYYDYYYNYLVIPVSWWWKNIRFSITALKIIIKIHIIVWKKYKKIILQCCNLFSSKNAIFYQSIRLTSRVKRSWFARGEQLKSFNILAPTRNLHWSRNSWRNTR